MKITTQRTTHTTNESSPSSFEFINMIPQEGVQETVLYGLLDQYEAKKRVHQSLCTFLSHLFLGSIVIFLFLIVTGFLEGGFTLILRCQLYDLYSLSQHSVNALVVGCISTMLFQSPHTVAVYTVALINQKGLSLRQGIFVVIGANFGSCLLASIVAFAQVWNREAFQRAVAASTVQHLYNILTFAVVFPLEIIFHTIEKLSVLVANFVVPHLGDTTHFVTAPVEPLVVNIVNAVLGMDSHAEESSVLEDTACNAVISNSLFKDMDINEQMAGAVVVIVCIVLLVVYLFFYIRILSRILVDTSTGKYVQRILIWRKDFSMFLGTFFTFTLHSTSLVTSVLTSMAGLDIITLPEVYPLVIGANFGCSITSIVEMINLGSHDGLTIAIGQLWFNIFGLVFFYVIPLARAPVLTIAKALAYFGACCPFLVCIFLALIYIIAPITAISLVLLCTSSSSYLNAIGWALFGSLLMLVIFIWIWYTNFGGRDSWLAFLENKRMEQETRKYIQRLTGKSCCGYW